METVIPNKYSARWIGDRMDGGGIESLLLKIRQDCGLDLDTYERSFLERRIQAAMLDHGLTSYEDFKLLLDKDPREIEQLYQRLFINKTEFFRDPDVWSYMRHDMLPGLIRKAARARSLRVWCAGCASGEEPYSVSLLIMDALSSHKDHWHIEILASDVNQKALALAQRGVYSKEALGNLPMEFFRYLHSQGNGNYMVDEQVRKSVWFQQGDLLHMMMPDALDLILCRNVMIYFTSQAQERLKIELARRLRPGGYLVLGSAEVILEKTPKELNQVSGQYKIYRKKINRNVRP